MILGHQTFHKKTINSWTILAHDPRVTRVLERVNREQCSWPSKAGLVHMMVRQDVGNNSIIMWNCRCLRFIYWNVVNDCKHFTLVYLGNLEWSNNSENLPVACLLQLINLHAMNLLYLCLFTCWMIDLYFEKVPQIKVAWSVDFLPTFRQTTCWLL